MSFQPETMRGAPGDGHVVGHIDYRLARNAIINDFRKGRLSRPEVCDAHPELLRAAINVGEPSREDCPICEGDKLRLVSYVFGSRLPPSGKCITSRRELARLSRSTRDLACYVVEVCPTCSWNHLAQTFAIGARSCAEHPGQAPAELTGSASSPLSGPLSRPVSSPLLGAPSARRSRPGPPLGSSHPDGSRPSIDAPSARHPEPLLPGLSTERTRTGAAPGAGLRSIDRRPPRRPHRSTERDAPAPAWPRPVPVAARRGARAAAPDAARLAGGRGQPNGRRGRPRWWRIRRPLFVVGFLLFTLIAASVYYVAELPLPKAPALSQTSFVYDAKGNILASFSASENRINVPLKQVPQVLIDAIVSTEDRHFFTEGALDPLSIARALLNDIQGGSLQGGSTITQQYVKQTYTTGQRSLLRKLREAVLAEKVQRKYSKTEILQDYLNTIYLGRGAYGVEAASQTYFSKDVGQLNLAEASLLAGLIRDPEANDPASSLPTAQKRQATVLAGMVRDHKITQAQAQAVEAKPIPSYTNMNPNSGAGVVMNASEGDKYFIEAVREELIARYGAAKVYGGGLRVTTTLDPALQAQAYSTVYQGQNALNPAAGDPAGALVSVDDQGNVRAMVGGQDYNASQVNLALGTAGGGSGRQAGSTFKGFLLAQLVKEGYSVESPVPAPQEVLVAHGNANGTNWDVKNFEGEAPGGNVSVIQATADSINTCFAQLVEKIGPAALVQSAESMGIDPSEIGPYPSLVLGTADVSPLEMASGYSTFAANGVHYSPTLIAKVTDANGAPVAWPVAPPHEVLTPAQNAVVTYTLQQVVLQGTGSKAAPNVPVAGKTGTTDQATDAWFIGYTPKLTTAVWMGYPGSSRSLNGFRGQASYQGGDLPAQMFRTYMINAVKAEPDVGGQGFPSPGSLKGTPLNLTTANEPGVTFPQGTGPATATTTTTPANGTTTTTTPSGSPPSSSPTGTVSGTASSG